MLNVDEVDDAAVQETVENIAGTTTHYKTETDVLDARQIVGKPEIGADCGEQGDTDQPEQPAHTLGQAEDAAKIANMGEVDERINLDGRIQVDMMINQVAGQL